MESLKETRIGKVGKEHINALRETMHSVKVLPKGVCGITSDQFGLTQSESAMVFLDCGIRLVKYVEGKSSSTDEAVAIRDMCHRNGALFSINDRLDLAIQSKADCLHLWRNVGKFTEMRREFGGLMGISVSNLGEAFMAQEKGVDYIEVGNMFSENTGKERVVPFEEFRRIRDKISLPIYAVGGIKVSNVGMIKKLGADGIMVRSAILGAPDPKNAARAIIDEWSRN